MPWRLLCLFVCLIGPALLAASQPPSGNTSSNPVPEPPSASQPGAVITINETVAAPFQQHEGTETLALATTREEAASKAPAPAGDGATMTDAVPPTAEEEHMLGAAAASAAFEPSHLFSMRVAPGETVRLFDNLDEQHKGWEIRGGFAVAGQDAALGSVQVTGPWGNPVWQARHRQSGAWLLTASVGTYEIEVTNPGRYSAVITIGWAVTATAEVLKDSRALPSGVGAVMASMSRKMTAMHAAVDAARSLLQQHSVRSNRNELTVESTQWRLDVYSIAETVVLVALACVMVVVVRQLAASSVAVFDDPRRRTHILASRRFAPTGMV